MEVENDKREKRAEIGGEFPVPVGNHLPESLRGIFRENQVVCFVNNEGQLEQNLDQEAVNGFYQVITEMWDAGMKQESGCNLSGVL